MQSKEERAEYRRRNKDKIKAYNALYHKTHGDKIRAKQKGYRDSNKDKIKAYMKSYRAQFSKALGEYSKSWRELHRAEVEEYRRLYYAANRAAINKKNVDAHRKLKVEILTHYSSGKPKCALCDETRIGALAIDHINGNGNSHRKSIGTNGSRQFYTWLKHSKFPTGYRVLCANHNWSEYLAKMSHTLKQNKAAAMRRLRHRQLKQSLMNKFGGKCAVCGVDDLDVLTIHHTNNDGAGHRRRLNTHVLNYYKELMKINDLTSLECRCWSCNDNEEYN